MLRLIAIASLGIMFAAVKLAKAHGVHVGETLFWRQFAGLPAVMIWLWWNGELPQIKTKRPAMHFVRMAVGLTSMGLNFYSMMILPMAEATTFSFAMPIFATILAAIILHEPTGPYRWAAVFLGFIGVIVAMRPGAALFSHNGTFIALSGALLTAGASIQMRRMAESEHPGAIVFWFSLSSLVPLSAIMFFVAHNHDAQTWAILALLAISGAIAQIFLTTSLRHAPVAAVLTMDYSGLIWSILFGYFLFDEIPGHAVWFGAPIIVAAGAIIAWREQVRRRANQL